MATAIPAACSFPVKPGPPRARPGLPVTSRRAEDGPLFLRQWLHGGNGQLRRKTEHSSAKSGPALLLLKARVSWPAVPAGNILGGHFQGTPGILPGRHRKQQALTATTVWPSTTPTECRVLRSPPELAGFGAEGHETPYLGRPRHRCWWWEKLRGGSLSQAVLQP